MSLAVEEVSCCVAFACCFYFWWAQYFTPQLFTLNTDNDNHFRCIPLYSPAYKIVSILCIRHALELKW